MEESNKERRWRRQAMDFPLVDLLNPQACYDYLLQVLHPTGLACPRLPAPGQVGRPPLPAGPVLDYQCSHCGCVFPRRLDGHPPGQHASDPGGNHSHPPRHPSRRSHCPRLARELNCDRKHLLELRRKLQGWSSSLGHKIPALVDEVTEADEMFQNAGEKGVPHTDPEDPPRRRANKQRGHGTFDNDRRPSQGGGT